MNRRNSFILAAAIPFFILLAMTVKPAATVILGKEIVLETQVVDPNDLFRGDYAALDYKIAQIPYSQLPESLKDESVQRGRTFDVYVTLKPEGKFYIVDSVSEKKPNQGIYLKGKLNFYDPDFRGPLHIDYSLDKYFVKQGLGIELQEYSAKGKLLGKVKVLRGYGILTDVEPIKG